MPEVEGIQNDSLHMGEKGVLYSTAQYERRQGIQGRSGAKYHQGF